jgi:hypothetical protein
MQAKHDILIKDKSTGKAVLVIRKERVENIEFRGGVSVITIDDLNKHLEDKEDIQSTVEVFKRADIGMDEGNIIKRAVKQ